MDCLFCKIVKGEIPCYKVYENDSVMAFLDINPINPGHVLVIPKEHFVNIEKTTQKVWLEIMLAVKKIIPEVLVVSKAQAFNLNINNGKIAGQEVDHLHVHIMPRFENDGHVLFKGNKYKEGEVEKITEQLRNNLEKYG
ncbi:hypothetical protein A2533_03400 [Candidatus Falkowbacteria bacterium RIFOXYD2_FULL_35_9]|uniref:HIT domain-containing protein n=1 Tax=Candidatus Falkowbacteria bacterium RIFOXYC2_FULL_36_12 TaxID=1798002 RepID=A0A1F5SWD1_9BACT|nr:MAG: hypothetical protein A2478_00580 [Candidatus Falkowbacteria bacterium RIFOXYC2_FULL_36_12]OGF33000.1 MAG: hypothetical protein A2223_02080 [Candidatus Falkowbacteria bacterium RIFOXYA2_FULL_35_8]OGF47047.1 MAG: hypothetical protein A2533_03400 [Candidatus Falkowbacteria bacterium RIFOXYD2_FULL_35_9]